MKDAFLSRLSQFAARHAMWASGKRILAAVSGGPDSLGLLLAMHEISETEDFRLVCCVVNHHIRAEAASEARFVSDVCRDIGVSCRIEEIDVPAYRATHGGSLETVARNLRYEALRRAAKEENCDVIATAHHKGDQAETVLYRILRGTGNRGLSGICPARGDLIRPFLCFTKEEISEFVKEYPYTPCHDASNDVADTTRNKIRLELMPQLRRYNPAAEEALCRMADSCRADEEYLETEAARFLISVEKTGDAIRMDKEKFFRIPEALRYRSIRALWLSAGGRVPEAEEAARIVRFLKHAETGKITSAAGVLVKAEKHSFLFAPGDTRHYRKS